MNDIAREASVPLYFIKICPFQDQSSSDGVDVIVRQTQVRWFTPVGIKLIYIRYISCFNNFINVHICLQSSPCRSTAVSDSEDAKR